MNELESVTSAEVEASPQVFCTGAERRVCEDIAARQQRGRSKYGTTVEDNPLLLRQWVQHAYEECLDQAVYLRRVLEKLAEQDAAQAVGDAQLAAHKVQLQIQPRLAGVANDHQVVALGGAYPIEFVGWIRPELTAKIMVARCGRCRAENHVLAVSSGCCQWCGWNANDPTQATIVRDFRLPETSK